MSRGSPKDLEGFPAMSPGGFRRGQPAADARRGTETARMSVNSSRLLHEPGSCGLARVEKPRPHVRCRWRLSSGSPRERLGGSLRRPRRGRWRQRVVAREVLFSSNTGRADSSSRCAALSAGPRRSRASRRRWTRSRRATDHRSPRPSCWKSRKWAIARLRRAAPMSSIAPARSPCSSHQAPTSIARGNWLPCR